MNNQNVPHILPLEAYRLPIWNQWDKDGYPCPRNSNGWMAYHRELIAEKVKQVDNDRDYYNPDPVWLAGLV